MSQIYRKFVTQLEAMDGSITNKIQNYISEYCAGTLFFMDDCLHFGSPDNVRQALVRLCKRGIIYRAAAGIYYIPKIDKWDGTRLMPSATDIAQAVAVRSSIRIIPDGQNALNILGLSTQVPAVVSFITDGSPRKIKTEAGVTLELKHTSDMTWFSYNSEIMLLIVMCMREIGEQKLNTHDMSIIEQHLLKVSPADFEHDIKLAPLWVIKRLKSI